MDSTSLPGPLNSLIRVRLDLPITGNIRKPCGCHGAGGSAGLSMYLPMPTSSAFRLSAAAAPAPIQAASRRHKKWRAYGIIRILTSLQFATSLAAAQAGSGPQNEISSMTSISLFLVPTILAALASGQTLLPQTSPKYKETKKVYDRLIRASGSAKTPPKLLMTAGMPQGRDPGLLARYNGDSVEFSEHVYDKCSTAKGPDDNCLSVLLGHELAHFYEGHLWKQDLKAVGAIPDSWLTANGQTAATPAQIQDAAERNATESQADYAGGMLAFQAGFDPTAHAVTLLKAIYAEFEIADKEKALPADAHPRSEERR